MPGDAFVDGSASGYLLAGCIRVSYNSQSTVGFVMIRKLQHSIVVHTSLC